MPAPELPEDHVPILPSPGLAGKCYSAIKNLDDPKLLAYYNKLQVNNLHNVNRSLSRIEFLKLVLNATSISLENEDITTLKNFEDLDMNAWYVKYVAYALRTGGLHGQNSYDKNGKQRFDADGNPLKIFRPNEAISRAEAAKILAEFTRSVNESLPKGSQISSFSDVSYYLPLAPYIQYAYNQCLLHGRNTIDGEPIAGKPRVFEPNSSMTLVETAKVLYNIMHFHEVISRAALPKKASLEAMEKSEMHEIPKENSSAEHPTDETIFQISATEKISENISENSLKNTPAEPKNLQPVLSVEGTTLSISDLVNP